jgi:hypothetical protein
MFLKEQWTLLLLLAILASEGLFSTEKVSYQKPQNKTKQPIN